ncbi:concanavalin A-like lectin/glucanase domain-containing protein [Cokeromyces recurvatus]|uniref:concanavalin A-like lectin/glucanase domain-containing protein n=1 Tax=Cokeromyces recurvatus TaxID=90255 RepID=UPI00221F6764|nr:concanavalin A-like lectin/glucanase domain-containing protein [Cokeromyces recurvatus]KAI7897792.1 concanavalin A-like lectin/glucanase domain-containing protein [Cokeromyces recurvatus]
MNNKEFEQEPPSYDHAFQTNLDPQNQVYQFGKIHDASLDSYERGEMFIQAFESSLDSFPLKEAQEIKQNGFINCIQLNNPTTPLHSSYNTHPKQLQQQQTHVPFLIKDTYCIQFWPYMKGQEPDLDVTVHGTHPFLKLSDYADHHQSTLLLTQHYFEITLQRVFNKDIVLAIGLCTQPYPIFRMPGWNKFSIGYHSDDGHKFCDDATGGQAFGPSWTKGDTVGCGYCPDTGNVFFTLNGVWIWQAFEGLGRHYYYPSIGADGPAQVEVNFGQKPFQYPIENWIGNYI